MQWFDGSTGCGWPKLAFPGPVNAWPISTAPLDSRTGTWTGNVPRQSLRSHAAQLRSGSSAAILICEIEVGAAHRWLPAAGGVSEMVVARQTVRKSLPQRESGVHSPMVRLAVAVTEAETALNEGFLLVCLLVGALVFLWPIYRWILFGLGTMFLAFGVILLVVLVAGGDVDAGQAAGFVGGGLVMRVVGGMRPAAFVRRHRRRSRQPV